MLMQNFEKSEWMGGVDATLGAESAETEPLTLLADLRRKLQSGRFVSQPQRELMQAQISELEEELGIVAR